MSADENKTATLVRKVSGFNGNAELYRLSPPMNYDGIDIDHVIVSAIPSAFDTGLPETYIFEADDDGSLLDWTELPGSFQGASDIPRALRGAGYEVAAGAGDAS